MPEQNCLPTMDDLKAYRDSLPKQKRANCRPPGATIIFTGETCKTCKHLSGYKTNRIFYKCGLNRARWSHSYGTDLKLKDPACSFYEAETVTGKGEE